MAVEFMSPLQSWRTRGAELLAMGGCAVFHEGGAMIRLAIFVATVLAIPLTAQEVHDHAAPEKLGTVAFPTACAAGVQAEFNRGVALLHSFAYKAADSGVSGSWAEQNPQ